MKRSHLTLLAGAALLAACDDDSNGRSVDLFGANAGDEVAVIATVAPDFSSGALAFASTDPAASLATERNATISDITVDVSGRAYFLTERFGADRISRYEYNTPETATWTYSTLDADDAGSANPAKLIAVSETKGYLLRYGSDAAWVVNPSAATEAGFKTGELDLSAYDVDGVPEMFGGVVVGGRLYIGMQRLEGFRPVKQGYVAVFDIDTDTEIDTGQGTADGLNGIPLGINNPGSLELEADSGVIYVAAQGLSFGEEPEYTGGIVSIDTSDFSASLLLDDGDAADHPYGHVLSMVAVNPSQGYFIGQASFGVNTVYGIDLGTGEVTGEAGGGDATPIAGLSGASHGPLGVDGQGRLWVGIGNVDVPGMIVVDPATDSVVVDKVETGLNPSVIRFTTL